MAHHRTNRYDAAKEARAFQFATALADALHELHISHKELAQEMGVSVYAVDYWTRGANSSMPSAANLDKLCTLLEARMPGMGVSIAKAAGHPWSPAETAPQPLTPQQDALPAAAVATPTNLPHQISSFIGREREMLEVRDLLPHVRLLTLTGAGGIGKTRLALQVATASTGLFPDGVWLVELAPLSDAASVPQAVAYALGLREEPGQATTDKLAAYIGKKRVLLLLDNCEHLVEECARLSLQLLQACPGLTVMATSREALRLVGETLWQVPPLTLPDPGQHQDPARLLGHAAVQLFVERATASSSNFALTQANSASIAQICTQLDGVPLAIELAAACVSFLTVEQLEARLSDQFGLLTTGGRLVLPRHKTLHAAIEWSYKLLSAQEQALFRRLSVFAGGWSLEGAEGVCAGGSVADPDVAPILKALVDKSLILAETKGFDARYSMLQTIREYSVLRLKENENFDVLRSKHAGYYATLAEEAEPQLLGHRQSEWISRMEAEHGNIRIALHYCEESGDIETGLRIAGALIHFWLVRGYLNESRERLQALLEAPHDIPRSDREKLIRARALNALGGIIQTQGDYSVAETYYLQGLALRRELGDGRLIARSLNNLGNVASLQGDYGRARELYTDCLALWRGLEDKSGMSIALNNLALVTWYDGDSVSSHALHTESLSFYQEVGDRWGVTTSLNHLGNLAWYEEGNSSKAGALYEKSLAIRRELNDRVGITVSLTDLGRVACTESRYAEARALLEESMRLCWEVGEKASLIHCFMGFAWIESAQDRPAIAARLLGAARALTDTTGYKLRPVDIAEYERTAAVANRALGDVRYNEAWSFGRDMSIEQAISLALDGNGQNA